MSINIKNALTPKREDGGLDHRYGKSISNVIDIAGLQTIQRLEEFYEKSFELEKKYGGDAFHLCLSLFKANLDNWELKVLKKSLRNLLQELGFKPYNVTRLIGAAQFQIEREPSGYGLPVEQWNTDFSSKEDIEDDIKLFDYIRSLPVRSKYELSLCSDEIYLENGFDKPIIQQITNSYSKILTTRELEALRKQYPKPKPEYWKGGRGSSNTKVLSSTNNSITQPETQHQSGSALMPNQGEAFEIPANDGLFVIHQDSTDIEHEAVQPTQDELFETVLAAIPKLNLDEVLGNEAKRSRLEQIQHNLETLSDMAKPKISRSKYV